MELTNKVVIITGSSSGIGKASAIAFSKEGAFVVITYKNNKAGADETLTEVSKYSKGIVLELDLTNYASFKSLFEQALKITGVIDVLINNAAITEDIEPYIKATTENIAEVINTDLIGTLVFTQHCIKIMQEQGFGKIINISSAKGEVGGSRTVAYGAAKAGLNNFTKTLAKILAPKIQVNAVAPGYVKTERYDKFPKDVLDKMLSEMKTNTWTMPEDIANKLVLMAKDDSVTGQIITIDN